MTLRAPNTLQHQCRQQLMLACVESQIPFIARAPRPHVAGLGRDE
eukprot:CAMPEP_0179473548 /NCGR_PEP_ID=MMETSP0799-20121207/53250_1 /TAXON_ID=46947 /ORGANISM="Geminigera cryophila, Strain CCMP2564" /LENGTH=44 /DNA_ID= /DNA_START= /DNA_END= /DNA_ORIENTATION=